MNEHEFYMHRCFELAQKGKLDTSPNPRVGCVIVNDGKIIGEGYHQKYGEAHAEVNAINAVQDKAQLKDATLYVNLEPCAHFGKTPPCAELIVKHKIPKVIISNRDPHAEVDGKGIDLLKRHNTKVKTGILEEKGQHINRRFFTFHQKKRPYIILKWAETQDGFLSRLSSDPDFEDNWITSQSSKTLVHLWRAEESAILIGKNTALVDQPSLTTRLVKGASPTRLIIDRELEVSEDSPLFRSDAKTIIFNNHKNESKAHIQYISLDFNKNILPQLMKTLYELNIQSVIVEGGAYTIKQFIEQNLWDEARQFIGQKTFGNGILSPSIHSSLLTRQQKIEQDVLNTYLNHSE